MEEVTPSIEILLIIRGTGILRVGEKRIPLPSLVAERAKYRPDLPWEVHLRLAEWDSSDFGGRLQFFWEMPYEDVEVEGVADDGRALLIRQFRRKQFDGNTLSGTTFDLSLGNIPLPAVPDVMYLTARLTDNALAMPLADALLPAEDGSLRASHPRPPTRIMTALGRFDLWSGHTSEKVMIGGRESRVVRVEPLMRIRLTKRHRGIVLPELIRRLQSELRDLTLLFTFLSRKQVGCSRISSVARRDDDDNSYFHEADFWQSAPGPQPKRVDELVNPRRMPPGALDSMYQRFRSSPHKDLLGRVAMYLAEAFHQQYIESQTLYAFTAFEAIVNALEEYAPSLTMDRAAFRRFRRRVETGIKSSSAECGLTDSQVRDVNRKVGELHRRPLVTRSVEVVTALGVVWQDLWPGIGNLETALQASYARRSTFIHAGRLANPAASARDAVRIACLAERIVYSLLQGDQAWLSPLAYSGWQRMPHDVPEPAG